MQTWQIMMGLGVLADIACLVSILWFWLRKDDGFDDLMDDNDVIRHSTEAEGGVKP